MENNIVWWNTRDDAISQNKSSSSVLCANKNIWIRSIIRTQPQVFFIIKFSRQPSWPRQRSYSFFYSFTLNTVQRWILKGSRMNKSIRRKWGKEIINSSIKKGASCIEEAAVPTTMSRHHYSSSYCFIFGKGKENNNAKCNKLHRLQ